MGSQGAEGGYGQERDRQRRRKLRGKACCCEELVTAQHEGGREAWGGRGLSRPLGDRGVRGGLRVGGP